ncbi:hypothetical protein [Dolichospermum flos-aquae]|uniref:Uncharacterized protein n=1 Tax=Dolichospermum flos-aquae CCAP 1403/13F TaxID=315271 RepID=A0A6H2C4R2_DOLFA|nr:hypothetical protein [Dolichospermum flos-aquae]QJB46321.1 hypothetical protein HGD76_21200 [Dolichospermum flos-aquae CCAP 1403/13F]
MNSSISYLNILEYIDPITVIEYLETNNWIEEERIDTRAMILAQRKNNRNFSILLPLDPEIPDFSDRMYEVFKTLEFFEQRPISEIVNAVISVKQIAIEKQREILTLKFKFIDEISRRQVPAKKLGGVLTSIQELFDAVGQSESGKISDTGKIQKEILERTELSLFETFQGSFGMKLALAPHPQQLNFLESPLAEKVTESFIRLINLSNNPDKAILKEYLLKLRKRSASRYRKFLQSLLNSNANFYFDWGSVNPEKGGKAVLSFDNVINTIEFINKMEVEAPEEYTVNGKLIAANENTKKLEIIDFEDNKVYIGKATDYVMNKKDIELTIGRLYTTTIQEVSSINPATGEEKTEYTIINLSYLDQ